MPAAENRHRCRRCGSPVEVQAATKIVVQRGDKQVWTLLCDDCALLSCASCGLELSIEDIVTESDAGWHSNTNKRNDQVECDKCGDAVSIDDAVELQQKRNSTYAKILCPPCLGEIGVPQGYRLERNLSTR